MLTTVKTVKLSVCDCGFNILAYHIPLNTEYQIDPNDQKEFVLICGGCSRKIKGNWVMTGANAVTNSSAGYLPIDIFSKPVDSRGVQGVLDKDWIKICKIPDRE